MDGPHVVVGVDDDGIGTAGHARLRTRLPNDRTVRGELGSTAATTIAAHDVAFAVGSDTVREE